MPGHPVADHDRFTHPARKDREFNGDPQGATVLAKGDIADVMKVR